MGNSQFNSAKDGEGGSGREGEGFSSYPETRTNAGAPSAFSDAGFAPSMRQQGDGRHRYAGVAAPGETGLEAGSRPAGGSAGDAMDVESKTDDGDEEEVSGGKCGRNGHRGGRRSAEETRVLAADGGRQERGT